MNLPIENLSVPISVTSDKRFFVKMSAYAVRDNTEVEVIIEISNGRKAKQRLKLSFDVEEDRLLKTNLRTEMFRACVQAQNKLTVAVKRLAKAVLESRKHFEPTFIGVYKDSLTYNARGFTGLQVKL